MLPQSDTEAYLWAKKAAEAGLAKAQYAVGYFSEVSFLLPPSLSALSERLVQAQAHLAFLLSSFLLPPSLFRSESGPLPLLRTLSTGIDSPPTLETSEQLNGYVRTAQPLEEERERTTSEIETLRG